MGIRRFSPALCGALGAVDVLFLFFDIVLRCGLQYKAGMKKKIPPVVTKGCTPEIAYPCPWQYKLIATSREEVVTAVAAIIKESAYILTDSHTSSGGRYVSMNLELIVHSEQERLSLYQQLVDISAVKIVL